MKITRQKGTRDFYLDEVNIWQHVEETIRKITYEYHMGEIRTPVFEATELFARGVGDGTDIVNKEMYTFEDKGGRSITLRPELTACVVRAYIENGLHSVTSPLKFWYIANMYRYEKMQKGRYREFAQFGVEIFGTKSYLADIEAMMVSYELFRRLGIAEKLELSINSIGCASCRGKYIEKLKDYVRPHLEHMCENCKTRFEKNPMRMIDCKESFCQSVIENAPKITDHLCDECYQDFEQVKKMLDELHIPYIVDKTIVRGLDYYNKTVFEYASKDLGLAVGGGGRYDTLVSTLGGPETPAVGFALGMDRIILVLKENEMTKNMIDNPDIYVLVGTKEAYVNAFDLVRKLRDEGLSVELDLSERSFSSQMKYANKINAKYVCLIGEEEVSNKTCSLKNMETGKQETIDADASKIVSLVRGNC